MSIVFEINEGIFFRYDTDNKEFDFMFIGYRNNSGFELISKILSLNKSMSYEPGSTECLALISAKENLLSAINSLNKIQNIEHIQIQLKNIYKELDEIHEGRRVIENKT